MKQLKSGIFKASNFEFNPKEISAHSYNWWKFVSVIKGKVIFNEYRYSVSTAKHQSKARKIMRDLGIKIDMIVSTRESLKNVATIKELRRLHQEEIKNETARIEAKRIRKNERARRKRMEKRASNTLKRLGEAKAAELIQDCREITAAYNAEQNEKCYLAPVIQLFKRAN